VRRLLKRLLKRLWLSFLVLVLLLLATITYLAGTQSGLQQLQLMAQRWSPGELEIGRVEGTLLDTLSLYGVTFRHQGLDIRLEAFQLEWSPRALFSGALHIHTLELIRPEISLPAADPVSVSVDTPLFPIELPAVIFPLQVRLDNLSVQQLILHSPASKGTASEGRSSESLRVDSLQLQIHTDAQTLVLDRLQIDAPQGQLNLQGQLTPSEAFALQLTTDWRLNLPGYPALQGRGSIGGSLSELALEQQLSGLLNAGVTARLQAPLEKPQLELQVDALRADLGLVLPTLAGQFLSGQFNASGNLQGLDLSGRWQARLPELGDSQLDARLSISPERLHLESLVFSQENTGAEVQLRGELSGLQQTPRIAVAGHWKKLRYPLQAEALIRSPQGQLQIEGTLKKYQLQLSTALAGPNIPAGDWQLKAQGDEQGLSPFTLTMKTLDGQLRTQGQLTWLPQLSWELAVEAQQINPGVQWPEWPGGLDLRARVAGALDASQSLQVTAELLELSGTLRDQALEGDGRVELKSSELKGTELSIQQLQLQLAGARLQANGVLGEQIKLDWSLQAPSLDQLLPGAQGSLSSTGILRGPQQQLQLQAELQGSQLRLDNLRIGSVDAALDIDLSALKDSSILLQADTIDLQGQRWQQLIVKGQGTPAQHQLSVDLEQGPATLNLALNGSWLESLWRGSVTRLDLQQELAGSWQLQQAAEVEASAARATVDPFCLERQPAGSGELCLDSRWSVAQGITGAVQARQLGLRLFDPWLPGGTEVNGQLQAQADFEQKPGQRPSYQASARILDTELFLEDENLRVRGGEIRLDLSGEDQQLSARLEVPLLEPVGSVDARVVVKDLYSTPDLDGQLHMALSELKFISLFTPQLQAIRGSLDAALTATGPLTQPRVQGSLQLANAQAELPALGIKLNNIELLLRDQPETDALQLRGSVNSGEGTLQLEGLFAPLTGSGQLTLKGERFKAVDTAEVRAWVSPDLSVDVSPKLIKIRGEVKIPEAKIKPPEIAYSAPVSKDVVIIDSEGSAESASAANGQALDARVRLTLGDKVEVDALGFKGLLKGSVLVEDDARRATRATGSLRVAAGKYRLYGQDLNIERGSLVFSGGPVDNPGLDLRVSRSVDEVKVGARVSGTLSLPTLTLFSEPAMPESRLFSYLLLGRAPGAASTSVSEQAMLLKAALALTTMGGNAIAENLAETFSIDELGFDSEGATDNTSLYIGKYLSPRLYVKYGVGLLEPTNTLYMRYRLNKSWSLESETGTYSNSGDLIYTLER
jgi:translocation and assembly module TamB